MPFVFSKNYVPPTYLSPAEKVEYSIQLVEKHRTEAKLLRKRTSQAQALQKRLENELEGWKQKYQESQDQLKKAKLEIGELRKEKGKLEQVLNSELDRLLEEKSDETSFNNILNRLKDQKDGLIKSLLETGSGTNNLAERELRPIVLGRKISFGSDTYTGMETTAIQSSVIQTLGRDKQKDLLTELTLDLQIGIHEKYSQYIHTSYFDSS